ncbi:MAG TPA: PepSY domain-containing protein [Victivallales bacterium]|nr:PepSY domain-containing protein [Victivallales bacterium]
MKNKGLLSLIAVFAITIFSGMLFADNDSVALQNSGVTIDKVIQAAEKDGLKNIKTIEFDDGQWELVTQANNTETKYVLNTQTSKLTQVKQEKENDLEPPEAITSLQNAVKAVQAKSYNVSSIDYEGVSWEVKAYDSKNLEYEILVNKDTSKILNTTMDD